MKAVAYLRVSDASQVDGHSLDAQERLFRELCRSRGWEAAAVYREEGRSAHSEAISRRPLFQRLLDDAKQTKFDVVVVHTLDRWSRNLKLTLETVSLLARHNVGLVSITENIDWSNPQGRLFTQMLGAFAEYYSGALSTHVKKGVSERARLGRHLGGIPFGHESCWTGQGAKKEARCEPEHPGGVHVHPSEGPAVGEIFRRYATGTATLSQLAAYLNDMGYRTRNMHRLADADGSLTAGPRLFTTASVRGILHNAFYAGKVRHGKDLLPGAHEALVTPKLFDSVQALLKHNCGRSETMHPHLEREYLLKGIIRCAYCRMPMWAQTYKNGHRYYREHNASRGGTVCPAHGGSITCEAADEHVGNLIEALVLPEAWLDRVLARIQMEDEVKRIAEERVRTEDRLRRLGRAYVDGLYSDDDYKRQKRELEDRIAGLVVPEADAAKAAGEMLQNLPRLWSAATPGERRRLLLTMLDAVYVDAKEEHRVVAIRAKPPFRPLLEIATTRPDSDVELYVLEKETPTAWGEQQALSGPCFWWRRGRVELARKHGTVLMAA